MRRWKLVTVLVLGVLWMLACEEQAKPSAIEPKNDSPIAGVWYLQSVGEGYPIAGDVDVRFEFKPDGLAAYERTSSGPEGPTRYELTYNLADQIISISSGSEDPGVPRITGQFELTEDEETLHIRTHSDERWVLTREARPGGELEQARQVSRLESKIDPMLVRVQRLAYACSRYAELNGELPEHLTDLVDAGLVEPVALTASGLAADLPARFARMTDEQRTNWLDGHSAFALLGQQAGSKASTKVVVTTLPSDQKAKVIVGMFNGAVRFKSANDAAKLLLKQDGVLPARWPDAGWSPDAAAGLEPLSD